ncbi:MAG TPA: DUF6335 family protein [Nitrospira sp.]|nr:DUF6335 family protein [Nitrospira sp.]
MTEQNKGRKKEFDADEAIRDYVESGDRPVPSDQDGQQTDMEWYDQAKQDSSAPPEAVLTGGDVDAAWDQAAVGDETVGGSSPTPDQDIVDEIGKALGVTYAGGEPLRTTEKIERRDWKRWELNPASSADYVERTQALDASSPSKKKPIQRKRRSSSAKRGKRKAA